MQNKVKKENPTINLQKKLYKFDFSRMTIWYMFSIVYPKTPTPPLLKKDDARKKNVNAHNPRLKDRT